MTLRSMLLLLLSVVMLSGCGSGGTSSAANGNQPALPNDEQATAEMAKQLGMSVADLQMKKQMLMDAGLTPQEIAKALTMGGDPAQLFKDNAESNTEPPTSIQDLVFFRNDSDREVKLKDYIGKYNLVLVFTRGYSGGTICPFCAIQTAQLAANYKQFLDRDARVMIVYPGAEEHLPDFAAAVTNVDREQADIAAVKWPVVLDPNLKAVELLDIAANLAQPSTFIIDKQGNVVFAYVGANRTDRPSVATILQQLDRI